MQNSACRGCSCHFLWAILSILAMNQFRRPDVLRPMSGDQQAPAAIPSSRKRGTRSLSTSIRWQPAMGLPEWGAKPGISSSEEETRRGRTGTMRLPGSTAPQPHCEEPVPLSACASHVLSATAKPALNSASQHIRSVRWCFLQLHVKIQGVGKP